MHLVVPCVALVLGQKLYDADVRELFRSFDRVAVIALCGGLAKRELVF